MDTKRLSDLRRDRIYWLSLNLEVAASTGRV